MNEITARPQSPRHIKIATEKSTFNPICILSTQQCLHLKETCEYLYSLQTHLDSKRPYSSPIPRGLQPPLGTSDVNDMTGSPLGRKQKATALDEKIHLLTTISHPSRCLKDPDSRGVDEREISKEGLKQKDRVSSVPRERENKLKTQQKRIATLAILATYHGRTNKGLMIGKGPESYDPDC